MKLSQWSQVPAAVAALAAEEGGVLELPSESDRQSRVEEALAHVSPRPLVTLRADGLRVEPGLEGPTTADGAAWAVRSGELVALTPDETATRLDAWGLADLELGVVPGVPLDFPLALLDRIGAHSEAAWEQRGLCIGEGVTLAGAAALLSHPEGAPALLIRAEDHRFPLQVAEARGVAPASWWNRHPWALAIPQLADRTLKLLPEDRAQDRPLFRSLLLALLTNAVAHRSFATEYLDQPVRILSAPAQLRLITPGPLVRRVVHHPSGRLEGCWPRNPRLLALLGDLGLAHLANRGGRDAPRLARQLGFRLSWSPQPDCVITQLELDPDLVAEARAETALRVRSRVPRAIRQELILEAIALTGTASREYLQGSLSLPRSTVTLDLKLLLAEGRIERTRVGARARNQRYRLVKAPR